MKHYPTDVAATLAMGVTLSGLRTLPIKSKRVFPRDRKYGGGYGFTIDAGDIRITSHTPDVIRVSISGRPHGNLSSTGYDGRGADINEAIRDATEEAVKDMDHMRDLFNQLGVNS